MRPQRRGFARELARMAMAEGRAQHERAQPTAPRARRRVAEHRQRFVAVASPHAIELNERVIAEPGRVESLRFRQFDASDDV
jgi:hypothetical protein